MLSVRSDPCGLAVRTMLLMTCRKRLTRLLSDQSKAPQKKYAGDIRLQEQLLSRVSW